MPKIRIYLKSGNQFDLDVEHVRIERDRSDDIIIKWETTWKEGAWPRIISLPPGNIEAVLQLTDIGK